MSTTLELPRDLARLRAEFDSSRPPRRAGPWTVLVRHVPTVVAWWTWRRRRSSPWTALEVGVRIGQVVVLTLVRARLEIGRVER